jgi:hypothetical protein
MARLPQVLVAALLVTAAACSQSGTVLPGTDAGADVVDGGNAGDSQALVDATAPDAADATSHDAPSDVTPDAPPDSPSDAPPVDTGTESDAEEDAGPTAELGSLTVSTGTLRPAFSAMVTDYSVTSLNSLFPISVTATGATSAVTLTIHGAAAQSGVASSFTLNPGEDFTVVATAPGLASTTYTLHYVPSDLPAYTVTTSPEAGTEDILLSPDTEYALMIDRAGRPLYYRTFLPNDAEDFQQATLASGAVVYTTTVGVLSPGGWLLGADHVMDQHFNDLADYQLLAYAQHGVLPAEGHDFLILDLGHYIAESYVQRTVDLSTINPAWSSQALVMDNVIQEVEDGNVLMEWDSANFPALYSDSIFDNTFTATAVSDYLHLNSLDIDPTDGNLVVSFRHTSSIIKINRKTGQPMWTLGGKADQFGLTSEQAFAYQHHARVQPDGSLTVFDDGWETHGTRVLSFVLDQVNLKVTSFQVLYTKPTSQPPSDYMGSAAPLSDGRLFVGWGGWFESASGIAASEIVGGSPAWSLQFTTPTVFSYRALPIASP